MANVPVTAIEVNARVDQAVKDINKLVAAYNKTQGSLKKISDSTTRLGRSFRNTSTAMAGLRNAAGILGLGTLAYQMRGAVSRAVEFDRAMTNIQKTTDITGINLKRLGEDLKDLGEYLGTASVELARITGLAGQLGIRGTESLLKFTEVIAKLQRATNLVGEEAATQLARVLQLTNSDVVKDIEGLGSVIVELGNNLATTEREFVAIAETITPTMRVFNSSATDILAFSAALSSVGIEGAVASTAILRMFGAMDEAANNVKANAKELKIFADVLGLTVSETEKLIKADIQLAGAKFLSNLGQVDNRVDVLTGIGIPALREKRVHLALSNNTALQALNMARAEKADPTELARENVAQLESMAGRLDQAMVTISNIMLDFGNVISTVILPALELLKDAIQWFKNPQDNAAAAARALNNQTSDGQWLHTFARNNWDRLNGFEQADYMRLTNLLGEGTLSDLEAQDRTDRAAHEAMVAKGKAIGGYESRYTEAQAIYTRLQGLERRIEMSEHDAQKSLINQFHIAVSGGGAGGYGGGFSQRTVDLTLEEKIKNLDKAKDALKEFYNSLADLDALTKMRRPHEIIQQAEDAMALNPDKDPIMTPEDRARLMDISRQGQRQIQFEGNLNNRFLTDPEFSRYRAGISGRQQFGILMDAANSLDPTTYGAQQFSFHQDREAILRRAMAVANSRDEREQAHRALEANAPGLRNSRQNIDYRTGNDARFRSADYSDRVESEMAENRDRAYREEQERIKAITANRIDGIDAEIKAWESFHQQKLRDYDKEKSLWMGLTRDLHRTIYGLVAGTATLKDFAESFLKNLMSNILYKRVTEPILQGVSEGLDTFLGGRPKKPKKILKLQREKHGIKEGGYSSVDEAIKAMGIDAYLTASRDIGTENILKSAEDVGNVPGGVIASIGGRNYYETLGKPQAGLENIELAVKEVKTIEGQEIKIHTNIVNVGSREGISILKNTSIVTPENSSITEKALDAADKHLSDIDFIPKRLRDKIGRSPIAQGPAGGPVPSGGFFDHLAMSALGDAKGFAIGQAKENLAEMLGIKKLAAGGSIRAAGLALVGERGPEFVSLPKGAEVTPLNPMKKMMGNQAPTINLHVDGVQDPVVFERVIDQQMGRISQAIRGEIMANVGDNSDFSRATGL